MSNEVIYKIILTNETENQVAKSAGGAGGIGNQTKQNGSSGGESGEKATANKAIKKIFLYHQAKSIADNFISYRVSTVQLRTGSSLAQEKATFWYNAAQKTMSIGESIATGAMFGGGPGAAIGAVVGIVNNTMDFVQKINTYNMEKGLENTTQDLATQRETTSGSRYQSASQI